MSRRYMPLSYKEPLKLYGPAYSDAAELKNRQIGRILNKYGAKNIVDFTCGTGSQVFWLLKHGFKVTGVDISPAMLAIAKERARKRKIKVRLLTGNMCTKKVGKFDGAITIFNAIGNNSRSDFKKAIRNIRSNLKDGGIYVFDIDNKEWKCKPDDRNVENGWKIRNVSYRHIQICRLNKRTGILSCWDRWYTKKSRGKEVLIRQHKWKMQLYSAAELRRMLNDGGFRVLEQIGFDGKKLSNEKTAGIVTVAAKV